MVEEDLLSSSRQLLDITLLPLDTWESTSWHVVISQGHEVTCPSRHRLFSSSSQAVWCQDNHKHPPPLDRSSLLSWSSSCWGWGRAGLPEPSRYLPAAHRWHLQASDTGRSKWLVQEERLPVHEQRGGEGRSEESWEEQNSQSRGEVIR